MNLVLDANVLIAAFVARGVCAELWSTAIVTGDKDLLDLECYRDIAIVSPRGFWRFESSRRSRR